MKGEIWYPVGKRQVFCAICNGPLAMPLSKTYPNLVCNECDRQAVDEDGEEAKYGPAYTEKLKQKSETPEAIEHKPQRGDNPVFIDGYKCWRRYKFGGCVTRVDQFDCEDLPEFLERHRPDN